MNVWRRVFEVNFFGVVAVTKAFLPLLKRSPNSRSVLLPFSFVCLSSVCAIVIYFGASHCLPVLRVVNVSSLAGITGAPGMGPYFASKHAVEGMAKVGGGARSKSFVLRCAIYYVASKHLHQFSL